MQNDNSPYTTAPKFCWENCSSHNILLNGEVILCISSKQEAEAVVDQLNKLQNTIEDLEEGILDLQFPSVGG